MDDERKYFLEGPVLPALMKFAVPVLFAMVLQALYGAVDLWAVGKFGTEADISAVSTGSQTMQIIIGAVTGLSMGTTVSLGQNVGRGNEEGAARTVGSSVSIFVILGVVLSAVMITAAPFIAEVMQAPDEAFSQTTDYIRICGGGTLFIVAYNLISAIFRGLGDSKSPLLFVSIACIVNIAGDIILIYGLGMGAAGAATATVAAQAVSVAMSLVLIRRKGFAFSVKKKHFRIDRAAASEVIRLGSPIALSDMCNEVSYLIIIGFVNMLGVTASAGVGIAEKLVIFILLIPMAFMQSISAFTAQNVGAGQYKRAEKAMRSGMAAAAVLGGIMFYISFFHGDFISTAFISDAQSAESSAVIAASAEFLKATSIECLLLSIAYCFTGSFNGYGRTTFVMLQGLCAIFLVKIPYAWFAAGKEKPQLFDIGLSTVFAAGFTLLICLVYYIYRRKTAQTDPKEVLNEQNNNYRP